MIRAVAYLHVASAFGIHNCSAAHVIVMQTSSRSCLPALTLHGRRACHVAGKRDQHCSTALLAMPADCTRNIDQPQAIPPPSPGPPQHYILHILATVLEVQLPFAPVCSARCWRQGLLCRFQQMAHPCPLHLPGNGNVVHAVHELRSLTGGGHNKHKIQW